MDEIFILCWKMEADGRLYATIKPSKKAFAYFSDFKSGEKTQFHTHDYIELAYIVEGEFQQRIMGKDIKFKKGEICLIDKNCLHQDYLFFNKSTILFIGLANEIFDEVMVEKIEEEGILNFLRMALMKQKDIQQYVHFKPKNLEDNQIETLLLTLLTELECNDEASKYICKGLLIRIIHQISTKYEFFLSNEQRKKMNWLVFEEITNYIKENYKGITIKDLVSRFHFNEDYYNRLLKDKTGMTYSEYVQNIKLTHAQTLLKTTSMTVDEVANQVGYHNKGYFYKIFVNKFGMTPSKYRKLG
jgi:AraC-like DNA-binding protein/mannose-6-phosphate isomerase-like protein (cupin superfamily)